MNRHIKEVHEGKKPAKAAQNQYKCMSCEKYFVSQYCAKRHQRDVHENLSMHKCEICEKSFKQKQGLQYHYKSAHGRKQCPLCKLSFEGMEKLKEHQSHCHRFNCRFCTSLFVKKTDLQQHITGKSL